MTNQERIMGIQKVHSGETFHASDIVHATNLSASAVSIIIHEMVANGYLSRIEAMRKGDPGSYKRALPSREVLTTPWRTLTNEQVGVPANWRPQ